MIIIWLSEIMFLKLWLLTLVCLHFCVKFGCTVLHGLRLCKILVLASKQIDVCDGHLQLRLWFSFTALTLLLLIIIAPLYLADVCQRVPRDTVFARLLTGISWSCDAEQTTRYGKKLAKFSVSAPLIWSSLPTTVRDISISMNSFSGRLKAELFCIAYGTDLAPMWQLSVNSLHEHKYSYLLTYLLSYLLTYL